MIGLIFGVKFSLGRGHTHPDDMILGKLVRQESHLVGLEIIESMSIVFGESGQVVEVGLLSEGKLLREIES